MTTSSTVDNRNFFQVCLRNLSAQVPQLRVAVAQQDQAAARGIARGLRDTVTPLGLPTLFQLGQDIESGRIESDAMAWRGHCDRFCDLLERIQFVLQQKLEEN